MNSVATWQDAIIVAAGAVLKRLLSFLPNLFGAVLIFLLGWIIAGWTRSLFIKLLRATRVNKLIGQTAVESFLKKAEWKGKVEDAVGSIAKWVIVFIFFIAAVNVLGLTTVSQVLNGILGYIPRVISAALILLAGVLLAGVVEGVVKGATGAVNVSTSRLLGKISSWIVIVFTILAAISELGIAERFINTLIIGAVATFALGLGLSLGLGSKDLVRELLAQWSEGVRKDLKHK